MIQILNWGVWIAAALLLSAFGKFLDEYHLKHEMKSRARHWLTVAFFVVDKVNVPDTARAVAAKMVRAGKSTAVRCIAGVCAMMFLVLTASLGGQFFSNLLRATVVFSPLIVAILTLIPTWFLLRLIAATRSDLTALLGAVCGPIGIVAVFYLGISFFEYMGWYWTGSYGYFAFILYAALLTVPFLLISITLLFLIILRVLIFSLKWLFMNVFDAASDPQHSPFVYATTVLSIVVLAGKVIQELGTHM